MNSTNILIRNNYVAIPSSDGKATQQGIATVLMNLSYYGYALNMDAYRSLSKLDDADLASWWEINEAVLKKITGVDRKIGDFVVYKNFPKEVLDKTDADYWVPQILMYWGFPNEFFTEPVKPREKMSEQPKAKVLRKSKNDTLKGILESFLKSPARWKDEEFEDVVFLSQELPVNLAKLVFKENLVKLASHLMTLGRKIQVTTATDVLRLAAGLSDGDVSLREKPKFISFKKPVRRFLLSMLEGQNNLEEDVARRPEMWKRLLHQLHAGDYKRQYPKVIKVMDDLYHDRLITFNSEVENLLAATDTAALQLLSQRPGEFRRRLAKTLRVFGKSAVKAFTSDEVLNKLTTAQVVTLRSHLRTVNDRKYRTFPPKGNWSKLQIATVKTVDAKLIKPIDQALGAELAKRLPKIQVLDEATKMVKLPNNGETGPYTRGTVFPIPENIKFIRTASYWENKSAGNTWFDNGWNFFDGDWKNLGACCWNAPFFPPASYGTKNNNSGAVYAGDPTNSKDMAGKAAELIDLYPDKLVENGARYAVWNVLCYSNIPFSQATDVFAALQWGEDPAKGKLFEPSRAQLSFPLTSNTLTKYVVVIDLVKREMIYIDANLHGNVRSAVSNGKSLEKNMPAFMEYIDSLPSVYDLFVESVDKKASEDAPYILYSDKDTELKDVKAYVFQPENKQNKYKPIDLNNLLI